MLHPFGGTPFAERIHAFLAMLPARKTAEHSFGGNIQWNIGPRPMKSVKEEYAGMIIDLCQVALTYQSPDGEIEALRDISFSLEEGEFVSIVGPSGCGKSTLLSVIAGLLRPTSGTVTVAGHPVVGPSKDVGLMPQSDQLFEWRTVRQNALLGLQIRRMADEAHRAHVQDLLERCELSAFVDKRPSQLSGGMRQRCALVRTLATDPCILLLDEPFSALDYQTRLSVSADIHGIIRREHKTALLVTHDIAEAISLSDRILVLSSRPAVVRSVHPLTALQGIPPLERRDTEQFHTVFNTVWKELNNDA